MDELSRLDIEHALLAIGSFVRRVNDNRLDGDRRVCCPNVIGSQIYHLLRSIAYTCCTWKEEWFLGLVDAIF